MAPSPLARASCAFLLLVACGVLGACGRKGPPRPLEDVLPQTIVDLSATGTAGGVQLSWSRPTTETSGGRLTDLGGFVVQRLGPRSHDGFQQVAVLEVTDRDRFRQVKRFKYLDADTIVGTTYAYRVVSFTVDRYFSKPSNVATAERRGPDEEKHAPLPTAQR